LENPHNISSHYLQDKDSEIAEKRQKISIENERKKIEKIVNEKRMWVNYHNKANLIRKEGFIDHKPPEFLKKGEYKEPWEIHVNMYRDDAQSDTDTLFRLYHKPLKAFEKFKFLGETIN